MVWIETILYVTNVSDQTIPVVSTKCRINKMCIKRAMSVLFYDLNMFQVTTICSTRFKINPRFKLKQYVTYIIPIASICKVDNDGCRRCQGGQRRMDW